MMVQSTPSIYRRTQIQTLRWWIKFMMICVVAFSCQRDDEDLAIHTPNDYEEAVIAWLQGQQRPNGLLESTENSNVVSLYYQSLAAMAFMINNELDRTEAIFDFFNDRRSELNTAPGDFSQFRDRNGIPNYHRWMGDNAWLLIALNNYKALTGRSTYDSLAADLSVWLSSLQDSNDGGLWAGYDAQDQLLNYKVTEGNIDAFVAINDYDVFHEELLAFLGQDRWNSTEEALMAWPENPSYTFALDNFSWAYCAFPQHGRSGSPC